MFCIICWVLFNQVFIIQMNLDLELEGKKITIKMILRIHRLAQTTFLASLLLPKVRSHVESDQSHHTMSCPRLPFWSLAPVPLSLLPLGRVRHVPSSEAWYLPFPLPLRLHPQSPWLPLHFLQTSAGMSLPDHTI